MSEVQVVDVKVLGPDEVKVARSTGGSMTVTRGEDLKPAFSGAAAEEFLRLHERLVPYHEAAHVCVAAALGVGVMEITMTRASYGRCDDDLLAMIAIAGLIWGATRGLPDLLWDRIWDAPADLPFERTEDDLAIFLRLARTPGDRRRLRQRTYELLKAIDGFIVLVGNALRERGRLSGPEIVAIINGEADRRQSAGAVALPSRHVLVNGIAAGAEELLP